MDLTRHTVRWLVGVDSLPLQLLALLVEDCASWGVISYGFPDWYWWMLHGWEAPFLPAFWRSMSIHPVVFRFRYANGQNLAVVPQGGNTGQLLVMIGQVTDLDIIWVSGYLRKLFLIYIASSNRVLPFMSLWLFLTLNSAFLAHGPEVVHSFPKNFGGKFQMYFPQFMINLVPYIAYILIFFIPTFPIILIENPISYHRFTDISIYSPYIVSIFFDVLVGIPRFRFTLFPRPGGWLRAGAWRIGAVLAADESHRSLGAPEKSDFMGDHGKLVGGLEHFLFSPIVGMMIQSD